MLFNSLQYAVFLPIVFALYWIVPHKWRWIVVLVSSYYFYMCWNAKYLLLIMFITGISYVGALGVEGAREQKQKKLWVGLVIAVSLALLFVFKYFNFLSETLYSLFSMAHIDAPQVALNLLLPVGISFYTFQSIGYIVDVYRGDIEAEHHVGKYAAFVAFFPQLVAGPIERASNLMPQLKTERHFSYDQAVYGVRLMAWGYFKKIVVADTLAAYVDKVYADMHFYQGAARLFAIFFFTIQIYCDFSGYSDIARGTAKLFGVELMENFKSPYFAKSIREFWRRWHISLSTWFRDYVYIPLGGNRVSKIRNAMNVMITFLLSGLWHGASWTFVTWGGLHGATQVAEKWVETHTGKRKNGRIVNGLRVLATFLIVSVLWVFFRAQRFKDAAYMLVYCYVGFQNPLQYLWGGCTSLGIDVAGVVKLVFILGLLAVFDYVSLKKDIIAFVGKWKLPCRWGLYIGFVIMIFLLAPATSAEFIYFDF